MHYDESIEWPDEETRYQDKGKEKITLTEGFSLVLGNDDGTIDNADVRVRWCVTPKLTKELIDKGIKNPHVLVTTFNKKGNNEWRGLFPLNEVMSFARFYQAGPMHITAYIVEFAGTPTKVKNDKDYYLRYDKTSYSYDLQKGGDICRGVGGDVDFYALTHEIIDIPTGVFDMPAPAWLEWYANLWHGSANADDACGFRTRLLIGTIKWIPMTIWMIFYYLLNAILLGGLWMWGLQSWIANPRALRHPFVGEACFSAVDSDEGKHSNLLDSRYVPRLTWKDGTEQPIWTFLAVAPMLPVFIFVICLISAEREGILLLHFAHETAAFGTLFLTIVLLTWDLCVATGNAIETYVKQSGKRKRKEQNIDGVVTALFLLICFATYSLVAVLPFWFTGIVLAGGFFGGWIFSKPWGEDSFDKYAEKFDDWYDWIMSWFGVKDDYTNMRELMCPDDLKNLSTDMHTLPRKHISWKLRFKNLKAAVCKPRARRG